MKRAQTSFVAGLTICVITIILVIYYKTEADRKNQDNPYSSVNHGSSSSAKHRQVGDQTIPRTKRRQRSVRESIDVLSQLGYLLTADVIEDHRAKDNVQLITPEGSIIRSDSVSISSDGNDIFLNGNIKVESTSGDQLSTIEYSGVDSFAKIALDGSSSSFKGKTRFTFSSNKK